MRAAIVLFALAPVLASAAPPRRVRPDRELRAVILDGGTVDVGSIRCTTRCKSTAVKRRFRLRVEGASTARFARVRAFVQVDVPGQRIRIDGRLIGTMPILVDAASPLGIAVGHTLEIEVPATEPAGLVTQTINWLVEDSP